MMTRISTVARAAWHKVRTYALAHKLLATIGVIALIYGGSSLYGTLTAPSTAPHYVTADVATSTVVATLTETGQVSASQQISLSPQASGQVIGVYVKPGDQVYAGQIVAQLDATTAQQSYQNAKLSYQNAQLSYQQTTASSTLALNLVVAKNGFTNSQIALQKAHDTAYASIASIYSDLGVIVTGLDTVLHSSNVAGRTNQQNIDAYADLVGTRDNTIDIYKNSAQDSYTAAYTAYNAALTAYKSTSNTISNDDLVALAQSTYTVAQKVADAVRNSHDFYDRVSSDYSLYNLGTSSTLTGLLTSTNTYTTTVSTDLSNALTNQSSVVSAEQALAQAENTLQATEAGSNALTVQSAALSLQQSKDNLTNAQTTLSNYTVTAPFSGTIAAVGVQKYDQAGSGTAVATLVTNQETANVSVNEVDAGKIHVGQKATLTFDALPDVSIAGTVASINSVGTVSQGVVSYSVTIGLDTPNASVMPGMSVTANIITAMETGLVVPASALKASGTQSYVEVFDPPLAGSSAMGGVASSIAPQRVTVTTGLTDNTDTIITSGLTAGAQVVTQTIAGTAAKTSATTPSILNAVGGNTRSSAAGGSTFRAIGGTP